MDDKMPSGEGLPDFFKKGFDSEGNEAMRDAEKDVLGEQLPELSFDIAKAFQEIKAIENPQKRLESLRQHEAELSQYVDKLRKRYTYWRDHKEVPVNADLEDIFKHIKDIEYALAGFREEIDNCFQEIQEQKEEERSEKTETIKKNFKPDDILDRKEAAEWLGVRPQTVSKYVKKEGRGHYKFSDVYEYRYGIKHSDDNHAIEEDSAGPRKLTTSIQLFSDYNMDSAIQLIKILSNADDDLGDSLISLGTNNSVEEFTKDHFHLHNETEKQCSFIMWKRKIPLLALLLLILHEKRFCEFPYDSHNKKEGVGFFPFADKYFRIASDSVTTDKEHSDLNKIKKSTFTTELSEARQNFKALTHDYEGSEEIQGDLVTIEKELQGNIEQYLFDAIYRSL